MLTELSRPEVSMEGMSHTPEPTWEDVAAAKVYQDMLHTAVRDLHCLPLSPGSVSQVCTSSYSSRGN